MERPLFLERSADRTLKFTKVSKDAAKTASFFIITSQENPIQHKLVRGELCFYSFVKIPYFDYSIIYRRIQQKGGIKNVPDGKTAAEASVKRGIQNP